MMLENPLHLAEWKQLPVVASNFILQVLLLNYLDVLYYIMYIMYSVQYFGSDTWVGMVIQQMSEYYLYIYLFFTTISLEGSCGGCSNLSQVHTAKTRCSLGPCLSICGFSTLRVPQQCYEDDLAPYKFCPQLGLEPRTFCFLVQFSYNTHYHRFPEYY